MKQLKDMRQGGHHQSRRGASIIDVPGRRCSTSFSFPEISFDTIMRGADCVFRRIPYVKNGTLSEDMGQVNFFVPLIAQGNNPICWIACVAMIKSFKSNSTRSISEFTGGFDPSSACIPGTPGSNDDRLRNLGFTTDAANMSIDPSYIEGTLRSHGPFIMFFFVANFPFTGASCLNMNGTPTDMHAVVVAGVDTDAGKVNILNPWGWNTPPADIDVIVGLLQEQSDRGVKPVAFMP